MITNIKEQLSAFGAYLFGIRIENELTQQQLADKVGVTRQTIANIEQGRGDKVSFGIWASVASALGQEFSLERQIITVPQLKKNIGVSTFKHPLEGYDDWLEGALNE